MLPALFKKPPNTRKTRYRETSTEKVIKNLHIVLFGRRSSDGNNQSRADCMQTNIPPHPKADEYTQIIETSTILAILSDYVISDPTELSQARQTLEILKSSASAEERTGFDPSGASGVDLSADDRSARGEDESPSASQLGWKSQTDATSLCQDIIDLEGLDLEDIGGDKSPEQAYPSSLDNLDEAGKEKALTGIFPALKPFDITWTLKKCKWDAGQAIDELMTQAFLEESGSRHRGIEAFSESEIVPRPRRGKGKRKRKVGVASNATRPETLVVEPPVESKWDLAKQEVEFLSNKTRFPTQQISSIYHKNGGSVPASITAIIEAHAAMRFDVDDPILQVNAFELRQEFPSVSGTHLESLLQITQPSVADARELARALTAPTYAKNSPIQIEFRNAPIELDTEPAKPKPRLHDALYPDRPLNVASCAEIVAFHSQARNRAFAQAQAAFRKGKSNPLMGGAAAYYSQVGRDADAKVKSAASAAADALVAGQSTRLQLDLHGVSVKDAVRISREEVTRWWRETEEQRASGRGSAIPVYKIVTGAGNHSSGGHGKLGPAVGRMLISEGWKIEVGSRGNSGFLVVTGRAKRR
ncbi:smr domain-containing protein [Marssonina coronariae]|uniref:Smr domain-containing protein n=1 Tax=Diplocarpon coronariae TaxID=2795749 RepID=A0A218Z8W4_9HELO|nr:smr domain-containing protein [Marssonina coronariae]